MNNVAGFLFLEAVIHLALAQQCGMPKDAELNGYLNLTESTEVKPSSLPFHADIRLGTKSCHGYFVGLSKSGPTQHVVVTTAACVPPNTPASAVAVNNVVARAVEANKITPDLVQITLGQATSVDGEQLPCPYTPDQEIIPEDSSCLVIEATSNGLTAKQAEFFDDCDDSFLEGEKDAFVMTCVKDKKSSPAADALSSIICRDHGRWYLTHLKNRQTTDFALYMDLGYAMYGSVV